MVRDDEPAAGAFGLVEHLVGHIHGHERRLHLVFGPPHDQPRIVIGLLERQRRKTLDRIGYLLDLHRSILEYGIMCFTAACPALRARRHPTYL